MSDLLKNKRVILLLFISAALFDLSGVIYSLISKNVIILAIFIIFAPPLLLFLLWWWNVDERTELALRNASKDSIFIFLVVLFILGIGFFVYDLLNNFVYWTTTSMILLLAFSLLFLQAIMSVVYELRMQ